MHASLVIPVKLTFDYPDEVLEELKEYSGSEPVFQTVMRSLELYLYCQRVQRIIEWSQAGVIDVEQSRLREIRDRSFVDRSDYGID